MGKSNGNLSEGDSKRTDSRTFIDETLDRITNKTGKELLLGTFTGWVAGVTLVRVGKIAAFGLGGSIILLHFASESGYINVNWEKIKEATKGSQLWMDKVLRFVKKNSCYSVGFAARPSTVPAAPTDERPPIPPPEPLLPPKPPDPYKSEEPNIFLEKATFLPPKPVPHSPKISPSSIPNPNPSPSTTKPMETGYPNYGGYLYSIPGYSAFQPISYPGIMQPNPSPIVQTEPSSSEFVPFPSMKETTVENKNSTDKIADNTSPKLDPAKPQTDFEEKFTSELIPAISTTEVTKNSTGDSKMSIKSLAQGSGATVTIPSQANKDVMRPKAPERFSLKTSIPISKIDIKCVSNQTDAVVQNTATKKPLASFNSTFQPPKLDSSRVEIQSNIVIKNAKEQEAKSESKSASSNSINTLINAAEALNKNDQFRKPEPKPEAVHEKNDSSPFTPTATASSSQRPLYSPMSVDNNKITFPNKPPESNLNEQKNQIVLIQNKNPSNPKMLLTTIQQQNPQVLLQRSNFESKNLQAPSRLSSQSKKNKDDVTENGVSSKVVALKRLHQENCDENDFENLITENQIYGNKIVVKEKTQGTLQEQDLKTKNKNVEKPIQSETKNVVLQPNFLYLSNVQFPANIMMIKNNTKVTHTSDNKINKIMANENRTTNEAETMTSGKDINMMKNSKSSHIANKEMHVLKSNNNSVTNKSNKTDIMIQTSQKVIVNPQIVYQVPMIVDGDNKINQQFMNRDYSKFIAQNKKDYTKQFDQNKMNDKLYIACPYQMDSKLQPKIVITNIRPKIAKMDEISSLDLYEKRKRMRRLKYLSNKEGKDPTRPDSKRIIEKVDNYKNIITPDKMKAEIYKEFANTRVPVEHGTSESDSDYGEDELEEYKSIINDYGTSDENNKAKSEFLANFRLATSEVLKEKQLERQERMLKQDAVASAYIAAGRLDCLTKEETAPTPDDEIPPLLPARSENWKEDAVMAQKKQWFLSQLMLGQVSPQFKEDYERAWQEISKERKRRNGITDPDSSMKNPKAKKLGIDTSGQLQILTEIKKFVNENNDLIKKRLDPSDESDGESIRVLAEKNFHELNRLSKMADHSIHIITGQDRKRDLNPGFDSENIQKGPKSQPFQNYPSINIPNISKIISLKTQEVASQSMTLQAMTSQAVSMDEPVNCAAGTDLLEAGSKEVACQVDLPFAWPGWQAVMRSYREFDAARKKEINDLHRRNTALRVDGAHITRAASCHSDRARALLAERQNLALEESKVRRDICRIISAIDAVKNYSM